MKAITRRCSSHIQGAAIMSIDLKTQTRRPRTDWVGRAQTIAQAIAAEAAQHDADDSFVAGAYERLKAEGLFKALVPAEFGGGDADVAEICAVIRILGAACGSTALAFA